MKNLLHRMFFSTEAAAIAIAVTLCCNAQGAQLAVSPSGSPAQSPPSPQGEMFDIRGPIPIPASFPWVALTVGVLLAGGLGIGTWTILRRPRRKLPYEIALEKLMGTRPLMEAE